MGVTKQSAGQKFFATEAGDGTNRFIDAQKPSVGVNLGNTDGGMFVSRRKPLVLLERVQTRSLEGCIGPLARGDVEKTIDRAYQLALRIAEWVDVDGHDQRGPVRMFDDSLDIAHRLSGGEHLGNQGPLGGHSVEIEEAGRLPELFVRLSGTRRASPYGHGVAIVLKDCPLGIADERRDRQQLEYAVGCPKHSAQQRRNVAGAGMAPLAGINHPHASAWISIPRPPEQRIRSNNDLSMARPACNPRRPPQVTVRRRFS